MRMWAIVALVIDCDLRLTSRGRDGQGRGTHRQGCDKHIF